MPTKKQYEKVFNKVLGTDIEWSKMKKEDMVQFAVLLNNPEIIMKKIGEGGGSKNTLLYEAAKEFLSYWDGPVAKVLRVMTESGGKTKKKDINHEEIG